MSADNIIVGAIGYALGLLTKFLLDIFLQEYKWLGEDERRRDATRRIAVGDITIMAKKLREDWQAFGSAQVSFFDLRADIFIQVRELRDHVTEYEAYLDPGLVSEAKRILNDMIILCGKYPESPVREWVRNVDTELSKLCEELVRVAGKSA